MIEIRVITRCILCGGKYGEGIIDVKIEGKKHKICKYCSENNRRIKWE